MHGPGQPEGFRDGSVGESTDYPNKYGYHFDYFPLDTSRGVLDSVRQRSPRPGTRKTGYGVDLGKGGFRNKKSREKQHNTTQENMKSTLMAAGLLAAALGTAYANTVPITVVCPNCTGVGGVTICATRSDGAGPFCGTTDNTGLVLITVPSVDAYTFCLDTKTLPKGTTLVGDACVPYHTVDGDNPPIEYNVTGGDICGTVGAFCWETGGGTLDKLKGNVVWSFGGVIYPGCSSTAAGGGNLNIVNHVTGLHFKGTNFVVDTCRGGPTKSPKVNVNIIDWHGVGYVSGDDQSKQTPVSFVGTFMDSHDSGSGSDGLYIKVLDGSGNLVFQIGNGPDDLDLLTTGNVQIHQTSCGK